MAIRLLIIGTGGMANNHAEMFAKIPGVQLVAGVDTRPEQLQAFRAKHNIPHGFASVDEALAWGQFDAATNVTPDPVHYPTTMPLLAAGKHVLCEKPLATSHADAQAMADAAAKAGVVNMVNLTYRNVAALQQAAKMVAAGDIGTVRHFEASYLQSWLTQPAWGEWREQSQWLWRLSSAHGSKGVLGDVGIHILDFATFIAAKACAISPAALPPSTRPPVGVSVTMCLMPMIAPQCRWCSITARLAQSPPRALPAVI
jgi:predicted dehydrogenase